MFHAISFLWFDGLHFLTCYADFRKASPPILESVVLHVDQLTRNVNEAHLREIFGMLFTLSFSVTL